MRNRNLFLFVLILSVISVFGITSCSLVRSNKEILCNKIQYDVPVNNNDPQLDWWINNIEGSRREPFLKRIMESAENGEVKAYDYFNQPLTPAQVKSVGNDTIYQSLLRTYPPYEEYDTMIVQSISYRDISKIRFMEEWRWDKSSLEMHKKVIAIGPVIQKELGGEKFSQLLYWISLDKTFPGK